MARAASLFTCWGVLSACFAQTPMGLPPCGHDGAHGELVGLSPEYALGVAWLDSVWESRAGALSILDSLVVLEVPVVVHVLHRGSPVGEEENISDAQVLSAIVALNDDFRKVSGTNGEGLGVDVRVEFGLAKRTPEGEPTTGIVRVDATSVPGFAEDGIRSSLFLPGADEVAVKSLTTWYGEDYLNVFVVPEINGNNGLYGVQGFAYTGPTGDARDGVTVLYNAFGTVGTLKPGRELNRTLTHEVGHHFSLLHTFSNTDDCDPETNCNSAGDKVCDTPVTLENTTCTSGTCPDAQLENYMDYTPTSCRNTFTAGQRDRMRTCLETVRASLLESLGAVPVVDVDLRPLPLEQASVCSPLFAPVLQVQNQGVLPAPGVRVAWSVNGVALSPVTFPDEVAAGATAQLHLPEVLLPSNATTWAFEVRLADGSQDDFPDNDTLTHVLTNPGHDAWTLTLQTDFFGNETAWSVQDSGGVEVWSGGGYPFGAATYVEEACIAPECYSLHVSDTGGDGLAYGGSLLLTRASGDTLAHLSPGTNFGSLVTFDVCATTPDSWSAGGDPGGGPGDEPCHDFNLNGLCDEDELTGCTYSGAPNYQPDATLDDGSCLPLCPGDLNGDGVVQLSDLLDFLIAFGQSCGP